jgi:hypothetical protein
VLSGSLSACAEKFILISIDTVQDNSSAAEKGEGLPCSYEISLEFPIALLEAAWRECLAHVEMPSHYNAPEFFLEPHWHHRGQTPFAVLAIQDGQVVAVLTGVHAGIGIASGAASRPQVCFRRDANRETATKDLMAGLLRLADTYGAEIVTVYSWDQMPALEQREFKTLQLEGSVVIDLGGGAEKIFNSLHTDRRKDVRFAIKHGIDVREVQSEKDVEEYFEVYQRWKKTTRKEIHHDHTLEMGKKILTLSRNHKRFLAVHDGTVVASSGVRFFEGGLVECANNCSLDEFLRLHPNDLLIWKTIEWACTNGFQRVSLGGAHLFLRKWGKTILPIYRYRLDRTWLRRHDLKENVQRSAGIYLRRMPAKVQRSIRRIFGK